MLRLCATGRIVAICMEAWDTMSEVGCGEEEEESGVGRNNASFASGTACSAEPIKAFLSQLLQLRVKERCSVTGGWAGQSHRPSQACSGYCSAAAVPTLSAPRGSQKRYFCSKGQEEQKKGRLCRWSTKAAREFDCQERS